MCNSFYGNKLFQSAFIKVIVPGGKPTVMDGWLYNLINIVRHPPRASVPKNQR